MAVEQIQSRILMVRGQRVMLDMDLASLYGVPTKRLNEQVKRNQARFPDRFTFQLTDNEKSEVVANCDHLQKLKYSPSLPYAFPEHGAIMAATVLNTSRAVQVSIYVVEAFVRLRELLLSNRALGLKLEELERRVSSHDRHIQAIFEAIRQLVSPPAPSRRQIGFHVKESVGRYRLTARKRQLLKISRRPADCGLHDGSGGVCECDRVSSSGLYVLWSGGCGGMSQHWACHQ
ncbi:MAG TPA: ORF6N domain-containing protein [Verrucomicrobiae bacterium]|nr:ORF6N domain-containing protein [Verrucomicrobiae bacterium]